MLYEDFVRAIDTLRLGFERKPISAPQAIHWYEGHFKNCKLEVFKEACRMIEEGEDKLPSIRILWEHYYRAKEKSEKDATGSAPECEICDGVGLIWVECDEIENEDGKEFKRTKRRGFRCECQKGYRLHRRIARYEEVFGEAPTAESNHNKVDVMPHWEGLCVG